MPTAILILASLTFLSTLLGGLLAVRFRRLMPYFFAFASGSLIAVTFFDILPESLSIAGSANVPPRLVMSILVISYLVYAFLEKLLLTHHFDAVNEHGHMMGPVGATGLVIHSFLDGVAIGTAYAVNPLVGLTVALAVIFHDFTDGVNTVTLMLKNKQELFRTRLFLFFDALAPLMGVLLTFFVVIGESGLALLLAFFAGEFLYIGASHLLPETHKHPYSRMMLFMLIGVLLIYFLTSMIS